MFGDLSQLARTQGFADIAAIQKSLVDPKLPEFRSKLHVGPEHIASGSGAIDWRTVRTIKEDRVISGKNRFSLGDIIYSKIRPYLNKVALADRDGLCSADMYVIQPIDGKTNAQFLRTLLMGRDFLAYAETCSNRANIPKLNRKQVEGYRFNCPSLEKQNEFAERLGEIAQLEKTNMASADEFAILFRSLQHRAFQGKL
jgi:type I restriction enzyme S subunit